MEYTCGSLLQQCRSWRRCRWRSVPRVPSTGTSSAVRGGNPPHHRDHGESRCSPSSGSRSLDRRWCSRLFCCDPYSLPRSRLFPAVRSQFLLDHLPPCCLSQRPLFHTRRLISRRCPSPPGLCFSGVLRQLFPIAQERAKLRQPLGEPIPEPALPATHAALLLVEGAGSSKLAPDPRRPIALEKPRQAGAPLLERPTPVVVAHSSYGELHQAANRTVPHVGTLVRVECGFAQGAQCRGCPTSERVDQSPPICRCLRCDLGTLRSVP